MIRIDLIGVKYKIILLALLSLSSLLNANQNENFLLEEYEEYTVLENNENYHEIIVFETHIAFTLKHINTKNNNYFIDGFVVYERKRNIDFIEHTKKFEPIYISSDHTSKFRFAAWFMGINNGLLFVDYGTGPGTRGLDIFDLDSKKFLFRGNHRSLSKINESEILVLETIDNETIKKDYPQVFNKHKETVQSYLDEGLYYSFSKKFSFNLKTKQITNLNDFICLREQ